MSENVLVVTPANQADLPDVLLLMQDLAEFEGYLPDFVVTLEALERLYLQQRVFGILVAKYKDSGSTKNGRVAGILVYFFQPFTYDLTPWLIVKELFVSEEYRGQGVGEALMLEARNVCKAQGGSRMKWEVLTQNTAAQAFYKQLGASVEENWRTMSLPLVR